MAAYVTCELLEGRSHFTATPAGTLDPNYLFTNAKVEAAIGSAVEVYQAVPAAGGRTYLLAERFDNTTKPVGDDRSGLLTIVAVNAAGALDPSFGTGGVALTGRILSSPNAAAQPGILKVDGRGRLVVADRSRVMRFRANGSADRSFGTRGATQFTSPDRPTVLCDIAFAGDGDVLVATLKTTHNVQNFAVQKVGRRTRTIWSASHNGGVLNDEDGGNQSRRFVDSNIAQFAQRAGGTVLARIQTDGIRVENQFPDAADGSDAYFVQPTHSRLVVTRFDAAGHGTDVIGRDTRNGNAILGAQEEAIRLPVGGNVLLSPSGRTVVVQTDGELLQFDLKVLSSKRSALPGRYESDFTNVSPEYQLLPDGGVAAIVSNYDRRLKPITQLYKFLPGGTPDPAFGDGGVAVVNKLTFAGGRDTLVDQVFLDSSGRLNFLASGRYFGSPQTDLTLRRL